MNTKPLKPLAITFFISDFWDLIAGAMYIPLLSYLCAAFITNVIVFAKLLLDT